MSSWVFGGKVVTESSYLTGRASDGPLQISLTGTSIHPSCIQTLVTQQGGHLIQRGANIHQVLGIGSKGGALPRHRGTFPPSALQTGRTTLRCIRLSRIARSKVTGACCNGDEPYGNHDTTVSFVALAPIGRRDPTLS